MLRLIAAVLAVLALQAANAQGLAWRSVTSAEGNYSVRLPGQPVVRDIDEKLKDGGTARFHTQQVQAGDAAWSVVWNEVPRPAGRATSSKTVLDTAVKGLMSRGNVTVREQRKLVRAGHPGVEVVYTVAGSAVVVRQRMYVVGTKLLQLIYEGKAGTEKSADANRFFDSLKLAR